MDVVDMAGCCDDVICARLRHDGDSGKRALAGNDDADVWPRSAISSLCITLCSRLSALTPLNLAVLIDTNRTLQ